MTWLSWRSNVDQSIFVLFDYWQGFISVPFLITSILCSLLSVWVKSLLLFFNSLFLVDQSFYFSLITCIRTPPLTCYQILILLFPFYFALHCLFYLQVSQSVSFLLYLSITTLPFSSISISPFHFSPLSLRPRSHFAARQSINQLSHLLIIFPPFSSLPITSSHLHPLSLCPKSILPFLHILAGLSRPLLLLLLLFLRSSKKWSGLESYQLSKRISHFQRNS